MPYSETYFQSNKHDYLCDFLCLVILLCESISYSINRENLHQREIAEFWKNTRQV